MTLGHISKQWTNEQAASQAQVTYEKYKKIKSFQDVGYLLSYYVVSGGEVTKNIKRNDMIDVADIVASLDDNILSRDGTSFEVKIPKTTYYLDFDKSGDWHWGTSHPIGVAGEDYLTIADVLTDAAGMVSSIEDKRGHVGSMRLKDEYGLTDYAKTAEVDEQFAETVTNVVNVVKMFGARGDGIANDTTALQNSLNAGGHVVVPKGTYLFGQLQITKDDTTLEFYDGVTIMSAYAGDTLTDAAIVIKGTDIATYAITADIVENSRTFTVPDASVFSPGDFLRIEQDNPSGTDLASHRQKYLHCICTVSSINASTNTVTVNEAIPHAYQISNNAMATKFKPVKNVSIIGYDALYDKMGTTQYASHIYVDGAYNLKISGIKAINGGGKAVTIYNTHTFHISDVVHAQPTNVAEGHGYGVHVTSGSCFGVVERVSGFLSRHVVDVSLAANNVIIKDCFSFGATGGAINGHGQNSKHIKVVDCYAYGSGFSIGNFSFLSDETWIFENCTAVNAAVGFNFAAQAFDSKLINCEAYNCTTAVTLSGSTNSVIDGLKLLFVVGTAIQIQQASYDIIIRNCHMRSARISAGYGIEIRQNSYNVTLENNDIDVGCLRAIYATSTTAGLNLNVKIRGGRLRSAHTSSNRKSIESPNPGIYIDGVDIISDILLSGGEKVRLCNNQLPPKVEISSTKNTMVLGNMGNVTTWTIPAHNGADIIVDNNLISYV